MLKKLRSIAKKHLIKKMNQVYSKIKEIKGKDKIAFSHYLVGFTDGEGRFSVSFKLRQKLKVGIECTASFSISQKKSQRNYFVLKKIRDFFDCGAIRYNHADDCYKYEIRSLPAIQQSIIPFFQKNKLLGEKALHFQYFCEICSLMVGKQHRSKTGLLSILQFAKKLNPSGTRKNKIEKLQVLLQKKDDPICLESCKKK